MSGDRASFPSFHLTRRCSTGSRSLFLSSLLCARWEIIKASPIKCPMQSSSSGRRETWNVVHIPFCHLLPPSLSSASWGQNIHHNLILPNFSILHINHHPPHPSIICYGLIANNQRYIHTLQYIYIDSQYTLFPEYLIRCTQSKLACCTFEIPSKKKTCAEVEIEYGGKPTIIQRV